MKYSIWNTARNLCVAEYEAESPRPTYEVDPAYSGVDFETRNEQGAAVSAPTSFSKWSAFDFLRRFTVQERVAARTLAKTDPVVEDFMDLLNKAANVLSDDPDTVAGMGYLVLVSVLTEQRMNEILGG